MEYVLLFIALNVIFFLYNKIAVLLNIVDIPNIRSSHTDITIRGGGIIFPISILIWFIVSGYNFPWFVSGLVLISIISFWDDLSHISSKYRFFIHILSIGLLLVQIGLNQLPWWLLIAILILLSGIINAYNFMDGINGITGGYSITVLIGIWLVNNFQVNFIDNDFIYYALIPVAIFNFFNFRPKAKCFAGDVGSISIAYIIVFLLMKLIMQSGNYIYILFLLVYGVDTILTIIHRILNKENIFVAHRKHLYQLLANELKISHVSVSIMYSFTQLIICLLIIFANKYNNLINNLILGLSLLIALAIASQLLRNHIMQKCNNNLI